MPCQIILGYMFKYTRENVEMLRKQPKFKLDDERSDDSDSNDEFYNKSVRGKFGCLTIDCDPENSYIYIVFTSHYNEGSYVTEYVDFNKLVRFRRRIEKLQVTGVIPLDAVFGIHTYH